MHCQLNFYSYGYFRYKHYQLWAALSALQLLFTWSNQHAFYQFLNSSMKKSGRDEDPSVWEYGIHSLMLNSCGACDQSVAGKFHSEPRGNRMVLDIVLSNLTCLHAMALQRSDYICNQSPKLDVLATSRNCDVWKWLQWKSVNGMTVYSENKASKMKLRWMLRTMLTFPTFCIPTTTKTKDKG